MKNSRIVFLLLTILVVCSSYNMIGNTFEQKASNSYRSVSSSDSLTDKNEICILTYQGFSLTGDSVDLKVAKDDINEYFMTANAISKETAIKQLVGYSKKYSIYGEMINYGDTLSYYILANGVGITFRYSRLRIDDRDVKFYQNKINIPSGEYKKIKSKLNVLFFSKSKFDFSIWESWKRNYPEDYADNDEQYKTYKRWNEELDANGICKAFSIMKKIRDKSNLNIDWSVDSNCSLSGLAIMDNKLYSLYMNGGGVMFLSFADNDFLELCYGCYKPSCLKYFTYFLDKNQD